MVVSSLRTWAIVAVISGTLICNSDVASALCGGNVFNLAMQCIEFAVGTGPNTPPSASCCAQVTKFDVKCTCNRITQELVDLIDVPKAVFVARSCGPSLPAGTKCGALTIPPARR